MNMDKGRRDNGKTTLRCVAVDDEPYALRLIADDIGRIPFLDLVATFTSSNDALSFVRETTVDLLFLDIQMPGMTGTEFLRKLEHPPLVIFTTAYDHYAVEGFELNVMDYLLKPVPFERFQSAVNRVYEQFKLRRASQHLDNPFFFVFSEYREVKIPFDDVLYIEGLKDYVKIFTTTQAHPILTRMNLKAIETKLLPGMFCRIHNSYIVSLPKIDSSQKAQVFIGKQAIPVGDKFAEEFWKKYRGLTNSLT